MAIEIKFKPLSRAELEQILGGLPYEAPAIYEISQLNFVCKPGRVCGNGKEDSCEAGRTCDTGFIGPDSQIREY